MARGAEKRVGAAIIELAARTSKFHTPIRRARKSVNKYGKDARKAAGTTAKLGTSVDRLRGSFQGLVGSIRGIAAGLGLAALTRTFLNFSSQFVDISNRLRLVTNTEEQLVRVRRALFQISQKTRTSLHGNAHLYSKLALVTDSLGKSEEDVLKVTELLNKQVQIGGSSVREAHAGLLQFGQAMASGVLQGEELRSVMENLIGVQQALIIGAQKLKERGVIDIDVHQGNIRELARSGILTAELLFEALLASAEDTNAKFELVQFSFVQMTVKIRNALLEFFGGFNLAFGLFDTVTLKLSSLADAIDASVSYENFLKLSQAIRRVVFTTKVLFALWVGSLIKRVVRNMALFFGAPIALSGRYGAVVMRYIKRTQYAKAATWALVGAMRALAATFVALTLSFGAGLVAFFAIEFAIRKISGAFGEAENAAKRLDQVTYSEAFERLEMLRENIDEYGRASVKTASITLQGQVAKLRTEIAETQAFITTLEQKAARVQALKEPATFGNKFVDGLVRAFSAQTGEFRIPVVPEFTAQDKIDLESLGLNKGQLEFLLAETEVLWKLYVEKLDQIIADNKIELPDPLPPWIFAENMKREIRLLAIRTKSNNQLQKGIRTKNAELGILAKSVGLQDEELIYEKRIGKIKVDFLARQNQLMNRIVDVEAKRAAIVEEFAPKLEGIQGRLEDMNKTTIGQKKDIYAANKLYKAQLDALRETKLTLSEKLVAHGREYEAIAKATKALQQQALAEHNLKKAAETVKTGRGAVKSVELLSKQVSWELKLAQLQRDGIGLSQRELALKERLTKIEHDYAESRLELRDEIVAARNAEFRVLQANFKLNNEVAVAAREAARTRVDAAMEMLLLLESEGKLSAELIAKLEKIQELTKVTEELIERQREMRDLASDIGDAFGDALEDIIFKAKSAKQALKALIVEIARAVVRMLVIKPIVDAISGALSGAFGAPLPAKAAGGYARGLTLVGERGPELVDFDNPARVYPNSVLRDMARNAGGISSRQGSLIVSPTFNIQSSDGPGVRSALAEAMPRFVETAESLVMIDSQRPSRMRRSIRGSFNG